MSSISKAEKSISGPTYPVLAIIINCFNYERYVHCAIQSVVSQNNRSCEIVVVDDGSTDRSWTVIQSSGVRAFHKTNGGQVSACLLGLDKTVAPFVLFLDADDQLLPNSLAVIISALDADIAKLQFPLTRIDEAGSMIAPAFPSLLEGRERDRFKKFVNEAGTYVSPPTSGNVFRRDVCELLREATYDSAVDGVILSAAPFFGDIVSLKRPLGCYRIHGENKSGVGSMLSLSLLERHKRRFSDRVLHLKSALRQRGLVDSVQPPNQMYFHNIYEITHDILSGKRVSVKKALCAVGRFPSWYSPLRRVATASAIMMAVVLPNTINARFINSWRFHLVRLLASLKRRPASGVAQRSDVRRILT